MGAEPIRDIPDDSWGGIFFETIDRVAATADLPPLRTASPGPDHLEVRLWFGFGLGGMRGFIVRYHAGEWSGRELLEDAHRVKVEAKTLKPRDGWDNAWRALTEKRLFTLPDFSTLPRSNYLVHDGSCGVVEVFAAGKYRTYMYPNSWAFDNQECREFEALTATFAHEFLGGDGKSRQRKFLSAVEIRILGERLTGLDFPLPAKAFLDALPVRLHERYLTADGLAGMENTWWSEWPLTNRSDPKGYYALVGYLAKTSIGDLEGERIIRHAEVVFRDRELEQTLVLQPQDFPIRRVLPPK